jgi:hypothetical protein
MRWLLCLPFRKTVLLVVAYPRPTEISALINCLWVVFVCVFNLSDTKRCLFRLLITPATIEQDLGNIRLEVDAKVLKEVKVEADKSNVTMNIDRKVYNADKDLSAKGGTAIDVMKNVPE